MKKNKCSINILKINEIFFALLTLCTVLTVYSAIWGKPEIESMCLPISLGITTVLALTAFVKKTDYLVVLFWLASIILSYISVTYSVPSLEFKYLKYWIMLVCTLNLFFWVFSTNISSKMIKSLFVATLLVTLLFVMAYLSGKTYVNEYAKLASFGFYNPNMAGIYLLSIFLLLLIWMHHFSSIKIKATLFLLAIFIFYLLWLTETRSCIIASITCILLNALSRKKYNKITSFLVLLVPIIFVVIYMNLIDTETIHFFDFMTSEGKTLTSRQWIWERAIKIICNNPITGNHLIGAGNRHNTHLTLLAGYGSIVFVLVIWFINRILNLIGEKITEKHQYTAIYAFYAIIIMGTFEAALFSGSQGMYVFCGGLLMMAKAKKVGHEEA